MSIPAALWKRRLLFPLFKGVSNGFIWTILISTSTWIITTISIPAGLDDSTAHKLRYLPAVDFTVLLSLAMLALRKRTQKTPGKTQAAGLHFAGYTFLAGTFSIGITMLSHAAEYSSNLKIYYNLLHPILYAPAAWPHHLFTVTAITSVMICINWHWLAKQARIFQPLAEAPEHVRREHSTW